MSQTCAEPLSLKELIAYDLDELAEAEVERVEAHYFACPICTERLSALQDLGDDLRRVVRQGKVTVTVPVAFVDSARARGLKVRRYDLDAGQQVACTVAPDDDFVAICLGVHAEQAGRVDIAVEWTNHDTAVDTSGLVEDVLVDRGARQVVLLFSGDQVRSFPLSQWRMEARIHPGRDDGLEPRSFGPYVLNHTPWHRLDQTK